MKERILVTGGTGYIGSHTVVELQNSGYEVIIIDNLSNSNTDVVDNIEKVSGIRPAFEKLDCLDFAGLDAIFTKYKGIKAIIHFAASKAVGESVEKPLLYYRNNLVSLINLLELMPKHGVEGIVFSSSCTVYGQPDELPVTEKAPIKKAESPYGNTKQINEEIIRDTVASGAPINAIMLRYFNPNTFAWDGPDADFTPRSDDLPWCMVPERKLTPEDVKYVLSSHYQGTPFDPYASYGDKSMKGAYRSIGINRNDFMALIQMRPDLPEDIRAVEWIAYASNAFNTMVPFYANVDTTPEYLSNTTGDVSTDNFYWASRLLAAMADASYAKSVFHIERYTLSVGSKANGIINTYDDAQRGEADPAARAALRTKANEELAAMVRAETTDALNKVLFELSSGMKNAYARSDA